VSLYGTGFARAPSSNVKATVGGQPVPVLYAGPQGTFSGVDQINLGPLPLTLKNKPGQTDITIEIDGMPTNEIQIGIY